MTKILDFQLAALQQAGCKRVFADKATGAHIQRSELAKCLKTLANDDTLVFWKLDRLGRSLRDLIGLLDDLKARGVAFLSLTEAIDTTIPTSCFSLHSLCDIDQVTIFLYGTTGAIN